MPNPSFFIKPVDSFLFLFCNVLGILYLGGLSDTQKLRKNRTRKNPLTYTNLLKYIILMSSVYELPIVNVSVEENTNKCLMTLI